MLWTSPTALSCILKRAQQETKNHGDNKSNDPGYIVLVGVNIKDSWSGRVGAPAVIIVHKS